jgi:hypothetical protein
MELDFSIWPLRKLTFITRGCENHWNVALLQLARLQQRKRYPASDDEYVFIS